MNIPIHFYDGSKYITYYVDDSIFLAYLEARNVRIDAKNFDGNLNAAITDVQKLAEIVDLLKKQVGPAGKDGRDGVDGQPGLDGEPGQPGADGRDGERGPAGEVGQRGADGKDGKPGSAGRDGADGRDGEDGLDGKDGQRGADGRDGLDGKDGKVGARGLPGIRGPLGPAGKDGRDGEKGEKGEKGERGPAGKEGSVRVVGGGGGGGGGLSDAPSDGSTYGRKDGAWEVVGSGVADHGALTGLADDDHTQYHNDTRGDARYALTGHTHAQLHDAATVSATANGLSVAAGQVFSLAAATATEPGALAIADWARVGWKDAANIWTAAQTINVNSVTGLLVEQTGVKDNVLVVDTTNGRVGINKAPTLGALDITGGVFSTSQNKIDGTSDQIQLIVQGHSTQTANLQEWQNSSGTVLGAWSGDGKFGVGITPTRKFEVSGTYTGIADSGVAYFSLNAVGAGDSGARHSGQVLYYNTIYSSGSPTNAPALYFRATNAGSASLPVVLLGIEGEARNIAGTITNLVGARFQTVITGASNATNAYQLYLNNSVDASTGAIMNQYGLYVADQNVASTLNYAIYTNAGNVMINGGGDANTDFQVQSDTEANMIFLDSNADTDGALYLGGSTNGLKVNKGGDTYWIGSGGGLLFGAFYGNELSSSYAVNNSYMRIADTGCVAGELNGVTYTDAGTTLTISKKGMYKIDWSVSCEASSANIHILGGIMIDSTTVLQEAGKNHFETTVANRQMAMSGTAIISCPNGNEVIGVGVGSDANTTLTADHVNLSIVQIGA